MIILIFFKFISLINNDFSIKMNESVLNIEPSDLIIRDKKENTIYTFLDTIKSYKDINKYYDILNSIDEFKLKNLYNFLYLRIQKLCKINNIRSLVKIDGRISGIDLNRYLKGYIEPNYKTLLHAIIIMNGIQLYFYPNISLT